MFIDLINKLDDRMNPIVVKEIRQYLNGRTIIPLILFTLLLELGAMFFFMVSQSNSIEGHGNEFFVAIMIVLSLACGAGIGFTASGRLTSERKPDAPDLMYSTALSPHHIINGKLLSSMTMVILLTSLCLPFMCVSYYMRGIDLPTILISTYLLVLFMLPFIQGLLLFGLLLNGAIFRVIIFLVALQVGFGVISPLLRFFSRGYITSGGMSIGWILFWATFITLIVTGGLYVISVATISHITANRALPVRIYLAATWLITLAAAFIVFLTTSAGKDVFEGWAFILTWPFVLAVFVATGERNEQSRRVMNALPSGFFGRVFFFLFSSGSAGGLLFATIFLLLTHAVNLFLMSGKANSAAFCGGIAMYVIGYAAIAMMMKNWIKRFFININIIVIYIGLIVLLLIVPMIICAMIYQERCLDNNYSAIFTVMSPAIFGYEEYQSFGFVVGTAMAVFGMVLLASEIKHQAAQYFPPSPTVADEKSEPLTVSTENADA